MFRMSWFSEYKGPIDTLVFDYDVRLRGLGHRRDSYGTVWDIHAIVGQYVCARKVSEHPVYYGTGSNDHNNGFHTWLPYRVQIRSKALEINDEKTKPNFL